MFAMDNQMKGFPFQVKGAMSYNRLRGTYDREIMAGDRVLFCYIKDVETQGICIPEDLNNIPEFVKNMTIDYDKQWATTKKTIVNYLKALKWDEKTRRKDMAMDLLGFNK